MPVDIFPYIDIPIVSVVWPYFGLSPEEMEKRVVTNLLERSLTSGVNDIEHIESQSYKDIAVVRVYFHPNVQIDMAIAQVEAQMNSGLRAMPPGMFPANVLKYDAGSVPILKLLAFRVRPCASRRSSIWDKTSSEPRSRPCKEPPCPSRSAGKTGR